MVGLRKQFQDSAQSESSQGVCSSLPLSGYSSTSLLINIDMLGDTLTNLVKMNSRCCLRVSTSTHFAQSLLVPFQSLNGVGRNGNASFEIFTMKDDTDFLSSSFLLLRLRDATSVCSLPCSLRHDCLGMCLGEFLP